HLADVWLVLLGLFKMNTHPLGHVMGVLVELVKAVLVDEALRLEQQLVFPVMNLIFRTARLRPMIFPSVAYVAPTAPPVLRVMLVGNFIRRSAARLPLNSPGGRGVTAHRQRVAHYDESDYQYDLAASMSCSADRRASRPGQHGR